MRNRDWPRALVVVWLALAVVCLLLAVWHTWGGNGSAAVGYGAAANAAAGAAVACGRWAAWRDIALRQEAWRALLDDADDADIAESIVEENRRGECEPW